MAAPDYAASDPETLLAPWEASTHARAARRRAAAGPEGRAERVSPPCGSGRTDPLRRARDVHRIALDMLTPNRSAALRRLIPEPTAATTRSRRSTDIGLPIARRPPHQQAR